MAAETDNLRGEKTEGKMQDKEKISAFLARN